MENLFIIVRGLTATKSHLYKLKVRHHLFRTFMISVFYFLLLRFKINNMYNDRLIRLILRLIKDALLTVVVLGL
jgi:hypothetical protein